MNYPDPEYFWNQAKRALGIYGIPKHQFDLFLKGCEWKLNYGQLRQLFASVLSGIILHVVKFFTCFLSCEFPNYFGA